MPDREGDQSEYAEQELRVLLERATPKLPAPEGRLQQVRERMARRRRMRRTGGATAVAVTAVVLAGTLAPDLLRDDGTRQVTPAAPMPSGRAAQKAAPETAVTFPELSALTLRLPERWRALAVPETPEFKSAAQGFAGNQLPGAVGRACPDKAVRGCLPLEVLRPGGVLLTLTMERGAGFGTKARQPAELYDTVTVTPACRKIGGRTSYSTLVGGVPDPDAGLLVTLCVATGTPRGTVDEARRIVAGMRFGGVTASPAPTPTPFGTLPATQQPKIPE
ncbi:hypothetical protein ACFWU3_04730 [Streptomyces sp. NPDC058685]|uniref:hypothetical protein n=1 Tax=Streptomyces sp. NPDC058685 TaxID=3346598 RepID=UPI00365C003E